MNIIMSSNGLYPDTRNQLSFKPEITPNDYVVGPDPYISYAAFQPPSLSSFQPQKGAVKYGQAYVTDNPFGQQIPGELYGPPIKVNVVRQQQPVDETAAAAETTGNVQGGNGMSIKSTWAQPPSHNTGYDFLPHASLYF